MKLFLLTTSILIISACANTKHEIINPSEEKLATKEYQDKMRAENRPVLLSYVAANHPEKALANGIEGYVILEFDISVSGIPENIRVKESSPEGIFEENSIVALKQWRYMPREEKYLNHALRLQFARE